MSVNEEKEKRMGTTKGSFKDIDKRVKAKILTPGRVRKIPRKGNLWFL